MVMTALTFGMVLNMKQPIKLYLRDEKQFVMIHKTKFGHKITYHDQAKDNTYTLTELIGGKIIV
jgi:hypothetical protein